MPIKNSTIEKFAPWGNSQLTFLVSTSGLTEDPETGNICPVEVEEDYLAYLNVQPPAWDSQRGIDTTVYQCQGRLLDPCYLNKGITNGSQARAIVNDMQGRFELTFSLSMFSKFYKDIRQEIHGTFRKVGGPGYA